MFETEDNLTRGEASRFYDWFLREIGVDGIIIEPSASGVFGSFYIFCTSNLTQVEMEKVKKYMKENNIKFA